MLRPCYILCLALFAGGMQPHGAMAQARDFTITATPELREAGILRFLLVRFTLKTQRRATWAEDGADLSITPQGNRSVMMRGDVVYGVDLHTENAAAERFAEWLASEIGQGMIADFIPDSGARFEAAPQAAAEPAAITFDGDAEAGANLAQAHCGRCHVVDPKRRMGGIGSTPSFSAMRALPDWDQRFMAFYALNPHPSVLRVEGISPPFDPARPPSIVPIELTRDEAEDIRAYAATLDPADLGDPVKHQ